MRFDRFAPALAVLAVVAAAIVFGVVGYTSESDGAAADPASVDSVPASPFVSGRVAAVTAGELTLATATGTVVLSLAPDADLEVLAPTGRASIRPGDWANASVVPHDQTVFVVVGIVVIPAALVEATP